MFSALLTDLLRAIHELFSPRLLTPDEVRLRVPAWEPKEVKPLTVPKIKSTARRMPGEAEAYEWAETSVGANTDGLTAIEWGYVVESKATTDVQVAAITKRGILDGLTAIEISSEASRRLGKKVSVSQVQKVSAALSKAIGEGVAKPNEIDLQID